MRKCWKPFILCNLSVSFFMSSMITYKKLNVSFSQLLCIASMLEQSLYYEIAFNRVESAIFSVTDYKLTVSQNIQILCYI